MKRVYLFILLLSGLAGKAQYNEEQTGIGTLRLGGGYTHDFPGLNGYTVRGEISRSLNALLDGGFAIQNSRLSGYPRTNSVKEFTHATTIDFSIYLVPLRTELQSLRFGVGYAFSFYNIRRTYPVIHEEGGVKHTSWPLAEQKGRISGLNISGEYEYFIPLSGISIGLRASLFKAYDQVSYFGPFVGIAL